MNSIQIAYIEPLESAWGRMKDLLFRPFDISRWLVIGFCAWLATLGESGGGGSFNFPADHRTGGLKGIGAFIYQHLALIISIVTGLVVFAIIVGLVVAWLSSRGKFMFLDNALTGRAEIVDLWRRWRKQGNSLFLWLIAFGFIMLGVLLVIVGFCIGLAWQDIHAKIFGGWAIMAIVAGFFLLVPTGLIAGYIKVFLVDFIVPLMRKHDLKTNAAWRLFMPLLRAHLGPFLLYGVIRFVVDMVVGLVLICAGCLTCCCLFCICAIPYIGTVLLLPLFVWQRYWGVEFMRQFGPDYDAWVLAPPTLNTSVPAITTEHTE